MWGYALDSAPGAGDGTVTVPGPLLIVPPGDTTLTINLTNKLPRPTSLHIIGQVIANNAGPVWTDGLSDVVISSGFRPANNYTARVRSFAHETAPNGAQTYQWTNVRPGTFIYQSGTNPAMQVSMGLYGGMIAGSRYGKEVILFFSEIDPVINNAVVNGDYGPGRPVSSMLDYHAKYFLINGKAYPDLQPIAAGHANQNILLRFFNAGLETHIPTVLNTSHMSIVAEDGVRFTYPKKQVTVELLAGKTVEAVLRPSAQGQFALLDRRLNLTNAGLVSQGGGGMLTSLQVGAPVPLAPIYMLLD
jgi:FtsP/CotA-like multicopper oxidase with cupredoxin domain